MKDQRFQPGDGMQACKISARRPFKAVGFRQLRQRAVDFPQQHRRRGGRAAATGKLTIDDDDIQTLAREALGDERSGNAAADDQRIAFDVLTEVEADSMPAANQGERPPRRSAVQTRRAAAAKVGLFGIVWNRER